MGTKIVVGIDPLQSAGRVTSLLRRLRLSNAAAIYASVEPVPRFAPQGFGDMSEDRLMFAIDEDRASRAIREAQAQLAGAIPTHEVVLERGEPSEALDRVAQACQADLVAIGSRDRSSLASAMFGSVGRGLALHSRTAVLIAKGDSRIEGPVRAVLAFDGSPSSQSCVRRLIHLGATGLSQIDVLIVREGSTTEAVEEMAIGAARTLREHGVGAECHERPGPFPSAVRHLMEESGAELAILGADLHGTTERVLFGSHALEQVVAEHHSVLILRPSGIA